ncbi:MAG: DUF421 domain-containing protein [Firmicutes bacterium]|nr:DUF421 domain-containing protein [Bacillota bacterium]
MYFWQGQEELAFIQWIFRGLTMFFWLFLVTKLMGQREVAKLNLFDFIAAISIGGLVSGPLFNPRAGLSGPIINVGLLGLLNIILAYISLKNPKLRRVFQEEPIVLIQNGKILDNMMHKTRFNLDDLLANLRLKNIADISDIEFAILESNGELSIIPKSQARPITPKDFNLSTEYEGMPTVLIEDGNVVEDNLKDNHLTVEWLLQELKAQGIADPSDVTAAILDTKGTLFVSKKRRN